MDKKRILVTGGAGFIGSHTVVELIESGYTPIIVDNLCNSSIQSLTAIEKITGVKPSFFEIDVRDATAIATLMKEQMIDGVIHFAALKAVGESVKEPLMYYRNNIEGLLSVLDAMAQNDVNTLIFSSSATVYGDPDTLPITEGMPLKPSTNPYGATKQMAEQIIRDICTTGSLTAVLLRYFNPIGAHASGLIGELPNGTPNNLVPYVVQAAAGIRKQLMVFGDDYDTPDGSGIRDYLHVVDLAKAHIKALDYAFNGEPEPCTALNIGTGRGTSVFTIIKTFEQVTGVTVPYTIGPRRPGDIASCYASPMQAKKVLGWQAELSLEQSLVDAWRWQKNQSTTEPQ